MFRIQAYLILITILFSATTGCGQHTNNSSDNTGVQVGNHHESGSGFTESFENGSKGAYSNATITLASGTWTFDDALMGSSEKDTKEGNKSVRIQKNGSLTMNFDVPYAVKQITLQHALFGTDEAASWGLWYSTDGGSSWKQSGTTTVTASHKLIAASFTLNVGGPVRFSIRKEAGGRLNIDNFSINGGDLSQTTANTVSTDKENISSGGHDDNMALGNPSKATTSKADRNNYLLVKRQYTLSYNNSRGIANWVSWHLSAEWKGDAKRCNCFEPDSDLPEGYFKAVTTNYTGTGFDRGHICPSDDRGATDEDNAATFLMTNMAPQAPHLNQQTWEALEAYCRRLLKEGKELYIIAGGYGSGGTGANGYTTTIADGRIAVPAHFWKIVVVLPQGDRDLSRIASDTRVIAVDMPNTQSVNQYHWDHYRTSVDAIEAATGYDFLSNISISIQSTIEASVDAGPTH